MTRPLPLLAYAAATGLLEPLAPAILRGRARRGKEMPERLGERLGRTSVARPAGDLVWLHGVSVGETTALLPLVAALRARRPDLTLLVTSGTVTAANLLAKRLPEGVIHQFAPVDGPRAVGRFLDHWRPTLGVFVESELWPNLILEAQRRDVNLALVSARITEASAQRWGRWPTAVQALLGAFDLILPQDEATAARIGRLGGACGPRLNLKRVGDPLPCDDAELTRLRATIGARRVVVAASTHPGEEGLIAQAFEQAVTDPAEALLMVVPRHPERGAEIATALGASRRSAGETPAGRIHVADTLGELGLFFRLADVVVMGGGFVEGIGGHNPLEPARLGKPILTGPHVFNAADLYAELQAEAAAITAPDAPALSRHIRGLLDHPHVGRRMGEAALDYAQRQSAALDDALAQLEPLLPA
ncbi:MAG: 3-deoxy-D-manno-octulosonic acid transferase [Phenylobacterium sp.]|nr:3-deoxy-D-manno-octulosonic acid transferase [Phenylobacterium sp.]